MSTREQWNQLDYYLIVIGTNIGFGCLWRFPYLFFDNGGAAFLIPYCFYLLFLIFPLVVTEIGTGQFYKKSLFEIYKTYHAKFVGNTFVTMIASFILSTFYIYILTYCIIFLYNTVFEDFPFLKVPLEEKLTASSNYFRK